MLVAIISNQCCRASSTFSSLAISDTIEFASSLKSLIFSALPNFPWKTSISFKSQIFGIIILFENVKGMWFMELLCLKQTTNELEKNKRCLVKMILHILQGLRCERIAISLRCDNTFVAFRSPTSFYGSFILAEHIPSPLFTCLTISTTILPCFK